ncbi:Rdx family protein [Sulfurospirillum sp. 1612]|uniref:Rdx family protein n=1 Tax=Sulfurospirillum sp. 1612 TaxID=3094835 RepID=UPI002F951FA1
MPRASRVEDEIKAAFSDAIVKKIPGERGQFDISVDGNVIFSKLNKIGTYIERFPDPGEIVTLLKKAL